MCQQFSGCVQQWGHVFRGVYELVEPFLLVLHIPYQTQLQVSVYMSDSILLLGCLPLLPPFIYLPVIAMYLLKMLQQTWRQATRFFILHQPFARQIVLSLSASPFICTSGLSMAFTPDCCQRLLPQRVQHHWTFLPFAVYLQEQCIFNT